MFKELLNAWKSESLVEQSWNASYEALRISHEMYQDTVRLLRESDPPRDTKSIRKRDKEINRYQRDIRRMVLTHGTFQRRIDPLPGMVLVSIVIDIERIGDYIKNILDLAEGYPVRLQIPSFEERLQSVEKHIAGSFAELEQILKEHDEERARGLLELHKRHVRKECGQIIKEILSSGDGGLGSAEATALALYVRYLKRISAHLKNIASSVVNPFDRIGYSE